MKTAWLSKLVVVGSLVAIPVIGVATTAAQDPQPTLTEAQAQAGLEAALLGVGIEEAELRELAGCEDAPTPSNSDDAGYICPEGWNAAARNQARVINRLHNAGLLPDDLVETGEGVARVTTMTLPVFLGTLRDADGELLYPTVHAMLPVFTRMAIMDLAPERPDTGLASEKLLAVVIRMDEADRTESDMKETVDFLLDGLEAVAADAPTVSVGAVEAATIVVEGQSLRVPFVLLGTTWETTYGRLFFNMDGTAGYDLYDGDIVIQGFDLDNRVLTGLWIEYEVGQDCDTQQHDSERWGRLEFTFSADFTHFDGLWDYCDAAPSRNWVGDRVAQ